MTDRILVVGAGAIGGVTAAHLARAGRDVTVLDANPEHVRLMNSPGLRFDELGTTSHVPIPAVADPAELTGRFDYALVTLKAPYLDVALASLVTGDLVDTYVSLGNGLVQNTVERIVGADRLVIGITEWGATNLGPGHLAQTTVAPFVLGEADGARTARVETLSEILSAAAEVQISTSIVGQVWTKLLLNSTFSGLGAVSGMLYRDVVADPLGRELAHRLWTEAYDVAHAAGIELDEIVGVRPDRLVVRSRDDVESADAATEILMGRLGATKASMLQDLERGASTEVDVINGGVCVTAEKAGVASPLNARIVELVHDCEQGHRSPGPATFEALAEVPA
ncbi:ketopantoate reductase family protein [Mycobacterium sp. NPDC003449]